MKIIQLTYDHTASKSHRTALLALCDDGSVWRQVWKETPCRPVPGETLQIVDPVYIQKWERAIEFDQLTKQHPAE